MSRPRTLPAAPRRLLAALLGAAFLGALPLSAQAPVITAAGDPSISADTIYRLAVRAEDHPDESFVYLLDDGVLRLNDDGTGTKTYRYVVQVLNRESARSWAERSFSYDASRERLHINWMKVVDVDGRVISDTPLQDQEGLSPAARGAPVFTDHRTRRISLSGIRPGAIIDYSYTIEVLEPRLPRDFLLSWSVTTGSYTRRSRLVLDVPSTFRPLITEHRLGFDRAQTERNGRTTYSWVTAEIPRVEQEPLSGWPNDVYAYIDLTGPVSWDDVGRWYHDLSRDRYGVSAGMRAEAREILRPALTREDSVRALHRWVAQEIRYVSLSLGIGGYQPRFPAEVLESGAGDCKDKSTLLVALLREFGIEAYPVLTRLYGSVTVEHPSLQQFDHMIVAVRQRDGTLAFADPTADLIEFGRLSLDLEGEKGLLVRPDGTVEMLTLPVSPVAENRMVQLISGEIDAEGRFTGTLDYTVTGLLAPELRGTFARPLTATEREDFIRGVAGAVFPQAVGRGMRDFDGRNLSAPAHLQVDVAGGTALTGAGRTRILTLPLPSFNFHTLIGEIEEKTPRRFPVSVDEVVGPVENVWEMRVRLPEGYVADLPENVRVDGDFGSYRAEYRQEGRELRVMRSMSGGRGVMPPESYTELVRWMREVSRDDVRFLVFERAP